ncbi:MAG: tetratricopeptide repeat protein [Candidatus Thermoplasmatota archaeon]|nr:tetratricopeptide repeat protein [Candidatus Thermoplasmatota archaeon]
MYIAAPPGTKTLARYLIPMEEYEILESADFNVYGEEKSLAILQFMRDLKWIYISYDEGDKVSLKPTETGIDVFEKGMTDEYLKENGKILNLIKKYLANYLKNETGLPDETMVLADHFLKSGNHSRALDMAANLIDLGNKRADSRMLGRAHYIYGTINLYKMDLDFAKNHYEKANYYSVNVDDIENVAKTHLGLGSFYGYKGEMEKALQYFEKALLLFKETNDESGMNQVKINEAFTLAKMGNIKEFFTLNHEAIEYFLSVSDSYHLQSCYQNESVVLLSLGEYNTAIDAVTEAYGLAKKTGSERIEHLSAISIALIYIYTRRPGDSYEYIEKAFDYFRRNFDTNGLALCYEAFMAYDVATKDIDSAQKNMEKMRQNYLVKKQHNLTVEGYSIYLRVMKIYEYPSSVILNKKEEFTKESQKLGLKEFLDSLYEDD